MIYLSPKSDIAFKKLFGDIAHKNIVISFLNSVLGRSEGDLITKVTMNDPNNVPETRLSKMSIVDVRCTDQLDNQYIIEMQIVTQKDYAARAQYYASLALSRQLASGDQYDKLVPVIFVGIFDFSLFKKNNYVSHHFILDRETSDHELKHLAFHFIELEKFNKDIEDCATVFDKWVYFLKHAEKLTQIPGALKGSVFKEAFDVLAQGNWSKAELVAYDDYLDAIRCHASQLDTAQAIGGAKARLEVAKQLLDVLDVVTIAQVTGLSVSQVEELKRD